MLFTVLNDRFSSLYVLVHHTLGGDMGSGRGRRKGKDKHIGRNKGRTKRNWDMVGVMRIAVPLEFGVDINRSIEE